MGTALCAYLTWNTGTLAGAVAGRWTSTLNVEGLDFAVLAVFISMIGASIRKWEDWIVLAAAAWSVAGGIGIVWYRTRGRHERNASA